jgi:ABC-type phosphate transport system substrate-binding protein
MNIKKLLATVLVGASLLVFAGVAFAATYDINIWGSSAQYSFWKAYAATWIPMQSGCSGVTPTTVVSATDANNAIVSATCGGNTYNVRVGNKASYDGVFAILGSNDPNAVICPNSAQGDPTGVYSRNMCNNASCSALTCQLVTLGASDVSGASFTQSSYGSQYGPFETYGTDIINPTFNGINVSSLTDASGGCGSGSFCAKPMVVPFSFYVNNTVTENGSVLTNLTRLQAVMLFSGKINNWDLFGSAFPNLTTTVCLRHAGSGTLATLQYAVVDGNGWGNTLVAFENRPDATDGSYDSSQPNIYFNKATADELNCINAENGAVGFADTDKEVGLTNHAVKAGQCTNGPNGSAINCPNVTQVAYNGEYGSADGIANGRYEFWTNEWLFKAKSLSGNLLTLVNNLLSTAAVSTNIPTSEQPFWIVSTQKNFDKKTDQAFPTKGNF